MNAYLRTIVQLGARIAAWMALVFAQMVVIGMSLNARFGTRGIDDPSPVQSRLWALALPALFLASLVPVYWQQASETVLTLGGFYIAFGGVFVVGVTVGLVFN
jgi:hypothetical protein